MNSFLRVAAGGLTLAATIGCTSTPADLRAQAPGTVARTSRDLGSIAGRPLEAEDLLVELHGLLGTDFLRVLDRFVATELARNEAARLGLRLDGTRLEAEVARVRSELMTAFGDRHPGAGYDQVVTAELGLRPDVHAERVREAAARQLVAERVVRAHTLASPSFEVRLLVTNSALEADALVLRLREGADFAELARTASVDDSASEGGRVPYLIDDERSPLARAARVTAVGEVTGPFELGGLHVVLRVERRREPVVGRWPEVAGAVEESLAADPVAESEFAHWQLTMDGRYRVDLAPLADLLGLAGDEPASEPAEAEDLPSEGD